MYMTTLFNIFSPFAFNCIETSIFLFVTLNMTLSLLIIFLANKLMSSKTLHYTLVFPKSSASSIWLGLFFSLSLLNLTSLLVYSFPLTTTLSWNLSVSIILWSMSTLVFFIKQKPWASFIPTSSPWYLASLLSMIEIISSLVRPITLCFRLLANLSAGHILLTLMCKMPILTSWMAGFMFSALELIVCLVQAFVFALLTTVYMNDMMTH